MENDPNPSRGFSTMPGPLGYDQEPNLDPSREQDRRLGFQLIGSGTAEDIKALVQHAESMGMEPIVSGEAAEVGLLRLLDEQYRQRLQREYGENEPPIWVTEADMEEFVERSEVFNPNARLPECFMHRLWLHNRDDRFSDGGSRGIVRFGGPMVATPQGYDERPRDVDLRSLARLIKVMSDERHRTGHTLSVAHHYLGRGVGTIMYDFLEAFVEDKQELLDEHQENTGQLATRALRRIQRIRSSTSGRWRRVPWQM